MYCYFSTIVVVTCLEGGIKEWWAKNLGTWEHCQNLMLTRDLQVLLVCENESLLLLLYTRWISSRLFSLLLLSWWLMWNICNNILCDFLMHTFTLFSSTPCAFCIYVIAHSFILWRLLGDCTTKSPRFWKGTIST